MLPKTHPLNNYLLDDLSSNPTIELNTLEVHVYQISLIKENIRLHDPRLILLYY